MKIEKINNDKIKCTLSKKDLEMRNINVNELTYGSIKARRLFQDMLRQAKLQFDFDVRNSALLIEAIPISEEKIILNISKVEEPDELDTRFSRFSPMLPAYDEEEPELNLSNFGISSITDKLEAIDDMNKNLEIQASGSYEYTAYFIFDSLKDVICSARIVLPYFSGKSSLKKLNENYLLLIQKGNIKNEVFGHICNILSDCGIQEEPDAQRSYYYSRHLKTLIPDQAIESLAKL